jgi:hypothetical protein
MKGRYQQKKGRYLISVTSQRRRISYAQRYSDGIPAWAIERLYQTTGRATTLQGKQVTMLSATHAGHSGPGPWQLIDHPVALGILDALD